jgi:hypothetical protein
MIGATLTRRASWHLGPIVAVGVGLVAIVLGRALAATRPVDEATPLVLATHLYALVLVAGLLVLASAIGRLVLRRVSVRFDSGLEAVLFSLGLGLGILANVVLIVGLLGWLTTPVLLGEVAGVMILARRDMVAVIAEIPGAVQRALALRGSLRRQSRGLAILLPLVEIMFAAMLLLAMAPPTANDALTYHIGGPRRFLELGRIGPVLDIQQANMPLTVNLLYLLGLAFGSDELGGVLHLALTVLVTAATFSFGRHFFGVRVGWLASVVSVSTAMLVVFATVPNVEWGFGLFDFLAVYAFFRWHTSGDRGWLLVSSVLLGFSMGSKLLGGVTAIGLGMALLVQAFAMRRSLGTWSIVRLIALFAVPAALIAAPWYVKNWIWFGNPLWPFFGSDPNDYNMYHSRYVKYGGGLLGQLLAPLRSFTEGSVEYSGVRPPPAFLLMPLCLLPPRNRVATGLMGMAALHLLVWIIGAHVLRYMAQDFPEISLASAYVLAGLWDSPRYRGALRWIARTSVIGGLLVASSVTLVVVIADQPFKQLVGLESRESYLDRHLQSNPLITRLNDEGEAVTGVLMVGDDRAFYLNRPAWVDVTMLEFQKLVAASSADEARRELRALGVSHILMSSRDLDWYTRWDPGHRLEGWLARFEATRSDYLVVEATNEDSTLYRVINDASPEAAVGLRN